ncbi:MAG: HDIG domain-containing protein [Acidimicrobiia bacterium]|nr:HDIG domain-containing protein [Acidimicrobiia bacterium]
MSMLREWRHLVVRFLDVLGSRRLSPAEQDDVAALLDSRAESEAFWDQPVADQRHGLAAAKYILGEVQANRSLARAALLHDIGKRHARLGVFGRSVAGAARAFRLPAGGRIRAYLDHGDIGAKELESAGAEPLVVAFTRHHHGQVVPTGVSAADWALLSAADHVSG